MKHLFFLSAAILFFCFNANGQGGIYIKDTTGAVSITPNSAAPASSAMLDVVSTTKGFLPPRMTQAQRAAMTPTEGLIIYNTTTKTPNYYDGTEWRNFCGTSALGAGDTYQGGVVAYILQAGDSGYISGETHGLIAAPSDQSTGIQWYNGTFIETFTTATAIGMGKPHTDTIIAYQGAGSYASQLCADLVLGGYSDWFLPSQDELNQLYLNKEAIGGFTTDNYWSSTEFYILDAIFQKFFDGEQTNWTKDSEYRVRAIRTF